MCHITKRDKAVTTTQRCYNILYRPRDRGHWSQDPIDVVFTKKYTPGGQFVEVSILQ